MEGWFRREYLEVKKMKFYLFRKSLPKLLSSLPFRCKNNLIIYIFESSCLGRQTAWPDFDACLLM